MVKRSEIHLLNKVLWPLVAFAAVFFVYQGVTEPYVPAPGVPSGGTGVLVLSVAVAALAYAGAALVETRSYRAAGDAAGLSPDGLGLGILGTPTLSGHRDGRPVQVRSVERTGGPGEADGETHEHSVVEARLREPTAVAVSAGPVGADFDRGPGVTEEDGPWIRHEEQGLAAVGTDEAVVRAVLEGPSGEALAALDSDDAVTAGDVTGVAADQVDGTLGSVAGALAGSQSATDEGTVVHEEYGLTRDGEALDRRVEAVAAVADAVESATGN